MCVAEWSIGGGVGEMHGVRRIRGVPEMGGGVNVNSNLLVE